MDGEPGGAARHGVERNHCKGVTFEWLHTVDQAIETFPEAAAVGTPPWRLC